MPDPSPTVPPIGAHLQIRGGLTRGGLAYADAVGARAAQVFVGDPRAWKRTAGDPVQDGLFVERDTARSADGLADAGRGAGRRSA